MIDFLLFLWAKEIAKKSLDGSFWGPLAQGEEQKSLYEAFVDELSQDGSVLPIPGEVGDVG